MHVETLEVGLFLFLYLFMGLLLDFVFAFGLFAMVIIFFRGKFIFANFIGLGFGQILVGRSG